MSKPYSLSNFFDGMTSNEPIETKLDKLQSMHEQFENSKKPYSTFGFYPRFESIEDVAFSVILPVTSFFTLATYAALAALMAATGTALAIFALAVTGFASLLHEDDLVEECLEASGEFANYAVTGLVSTVYLALMTLVSPLADTLSLLIRSVESIASEIQECIHTEDISFTCH